MIRKVTKSSIHGEIRISNPKMSAGLCLESNSNYYENEGKSCSENQVGNTRRWTREKLNFKKIYISDSI